MTVKATDASFEQEVLKSVKVNIDENPMAPTRYGVRSIPTLLLFKNGQVAATKIGAEPKQKLVSWINTVV